MTSDASFTDGWLLPDALFDGETLSTGRGVLLQDGVVKAIDTPPDGAPATPVDGTLSPGFFDIQVNGGGGVLFNAEQSKSALAQIAQGHAQGGTTHWLPTVITDAPEVMTACVDAIIDHHSTHGIAGIHIEGPHIALARKGTHKSRWIRDFEAETLAHVTRLRKAGIPTLITVAPEAMGDGDIQRLCDLGAIVSLGHTNASAEEAESALLEGAQLFTHLFNAMSQMGNRAPGVVGAAIASDAYCSVIADGYHVDDRMLGIAMRARPVADRMILVSDAMPTVGGPDTFNLYGQDIKLCDGRLVNSEGSLAGAHVTMLQSVKRTVDKLGQPLSEALKMATSTPATLMDVPRNIGRIEIGQRPQLIALDDALETVTFIT